MSNDLNSVGIEKADTEDHEYHESEDEDYDPKKEWSSPRSSDKAQKDGDDDNDGDFEVTEEDKKAFKGYDVIESTTGGLVKTRHQRRVEEEDEKLRRRQRFGAASSKDSGGADIDSIWADLKGQSKKVLSRNGTPTGSSSELKESRSEINTQVEQETSSPSESSSLEPQKVKIKRTYEFAGKIVTEEKWVESNSQEARAQMNSTKLKETPAAKPVKSEKISQDNLRNGRPLRRKRKRAGLLEAVINNSSAAKISTLEKSRLDWATYVDRTKINDELKYKNKAGYLANQDFLDRVNNRQDSLFRDARAGARKKQ
ncbi:DEKNAAC104730 [Brettanomyces naardenensis]|uniref:SWR1-complex protein 5 n=1 Tax=Brettanomyces naardenensis TaxID=13370 RepID=A0A448YR52_BRENA|nr:DEKNAAC104730 [Brettanomyces naardenensis]